MLDAISQGQPDRESLHKPETRSGWRVPTLDDVLVGLLLIGIMLMGGYFRFQSTNWDDLVNFHPDERFFSDLTSLLGRSSPVFSDGHEIEQAPLCAARYPDNNGVGGYFDANCSTLNPHNVGKGHYAYGTFPILTTHFTATLLNQINNTTIYKGYDDITLVGRSLSALYDTIAILAVFLIGQKIHGKWAGLAAAALYACAVLPIQIAHFGTADAMTTMWVALTLVFVVRTHQDGGWLNYALSGAMFGASLAARFNVIPLVVTIIGVAFVRLLPLLDARLTPEERQRGAVRDFGGLVLAGFMTLLIFRIFNPYAFTGPSFFGILPNPRWLEDLSSARQETSIHNDGPPHWQWVGRATYLFAWSNMVLWGMGIAFGLTGWLAFIWSGWRLLRGRPNATKNMLLFLWVAVYFTWVGANFVMSMRYYLVLYSALAVLAGWAVVEVVKRTFRPTIQHKRRPSVIQKALALAVPVVVIGFTALWALMFTNVYRNLSTFTQASHWILENAPGDFAMQIDGTTTDEVPLINIALPNRGAISSNMVFESSTRIFSDFPSTFVFTAPADGVVSRVHAPHIGVEAPTETTPVTLEITISAEAVDGTVGEVLATGQITDIFTYDPNTVGKAYDIALDTPLQVTQGERYLFSAQVLRGSALVTGGSLFTWEGVWDEVVPPGVCRLPDGVTLADNPRPSNGRVENCQFFDPLHALIYANQFDIFRNDDTVKRDDVIRLLDNSDYLIIGTNRRYDSHSRNPIRWPLTNVYYDALFAGDLGYDIAATFEETFELGPLKVSDQYLPTYKAAGIPAWLNEFEAEEAFHVYDHPVVYIFKRSPNYDGQRVREILYSVVLNEPPMVSSYNDPLLAGQTYWSVEDADASPTALQFTPDMQATQTEGGTWSDRFDRDSLINTNQIVAVVAWWLVMTLFGLVVWPLLFVAFPGLADRGYGFAKIFGTFLISWIAWFLSGTVRLPLWSPDGVRLIALVLGVVALLVALRNREKMRGYIREHARLLLTIEALWLVMYLAFVLVRLSNPDLWTTGFGGEKPMDVAYLNGILRSTIFPPIDPWYAGGFLNYYYYGWVIVGTPILFLQMVSALAYNLILPSLFAATGVGAFSAAFSVVNALGRRTPPRNTAYSLPLPNHEEGEPTEGSRAKALTRLGNPYIAGIAALLLAAVFGNLDTPRVMLQGLERSGEFTEYGYDRETFSPMEFLKQEYEAEHGAPPDEVTMAGLALRSQNLSFSERLRYEFTFKRDQIRMVLTGLGKFLTERIPPSINADRWFWGPSRVIAEGNDEQAITEMPYFTFVYGDLHAHMIAMPLMLFAVAFVFNELVLAGRERRGLISRILAVALGGLTIGMFQAINTWDWPTFTLLAVLGLGYAWWLSWRRITRRSLWAMLAYVGGFVVVNYFVRMPYTLWFASNYTSLNTWDGPKTALWMYLDIYGLFLFIILTLLVWETARWLRATRVRSLRGKLPYLVGGLGVIAVVVFAAIVASVTDYQVALIVLPLVAWIGLLFFRPGQSAPMQFVLVLIGLALCITLGVEVVVLAGDNGRQNMVFKFYIQAWLLLSIACGAGFAWLLESSDSWRGWLRAAWFVPLVLMSVAAALFPIMATAGKAVYRLSSDVPPTLNGADFIRYAQGYSTESIAQTFYPVDMAADAEAITWLQDNVQGSPTIIEGVTKDVLYTWGGRISIQTGLPTVIGWDHHQRQQRTLEPLASFVNQRIANVNYFYRTDDLEGAWRILAHYNVEYVVVAGLERARYVGSGGFAKFDEMVNRGWLEIVHELPFTQTDVFPADAPTTSRIYRVVKSANPDAFLVQDTFDLTTGQ